MNIGFVIPDKKMPWDGIHQGIGYIAAFALKHFPVSECEVLQTSKATSKETTEFLARNWDIIAMTVTFHGYDEVAELARMAKALGPAKIVIGGPEVTTLQDTAEAIHLKTSKHKTVAEEKTLTNLDAVDFAIYGEGEITFCELLECLDSNGDFFKIKGLIHWDKDGNIHKNPPREFAPDLEIFPYPDRSLFANDYIHHTIIGTRGCPYQCTYCGNSMIWGRKYRLRKPETVIEEIKYTMDNFGKKFLVFNDDSFNLNKKWVMDLCGRIKELDIRWWIRGLRAGLVDEEVADILAASGCHGAACGIESANNAALKAMRKGTTKEQMEMGVELMRARGLEITGQFMIGNHGDTLETIKETIEFARKFDQVSFGVAKPIPGTYLYDYVMENDYMLKDPVPIMHKGKAIDWIVFDTPHFPAKKQLEAVKLTVENRMFHFIDYETGKWSYFKPSYM
ncbi:MAG: B12-binding domain-containing radical SAM protein, partial [Nitrospirota bacterium]